MRKMLFVLPLVLVADFMLHLLNINDFDELREFLPLTFIFFAMSQTRNDFAGNFLFHKLSVNLPEMTKAFFSHYSLIFAGQLILIIIYDLVSSTYHSPFSKMSYTFTEALSHLILCYVLLMVHSVMAISVHIKQQQMRLSKSKRFWFLFLWFLSMLLAMVIGIVLSIGKMEFNSIIYFVVPITFAVGFVVPTFLSDVNLRPVELNFFSYCKFMTLGFVVATGLFFGLAYLGQDDFKQSNLAVSHRVNLHMKWSPLSDSLDAETFKTFVLNIPVESTIQMKHLYSNLPNSELRKVTIDDFLNKTDNQQETVIISRDSSLRLIMLFKHSDFPQHLDDFVVGLSSGKYKFVSIKEKAVLLSMIEKSWTKIEDPAYKRLVNFKKDFEKDRLPASK